MSRAGYPRRGLHGELVHAIGLSIVRGELAPGALLPLEQTVPGEAPSRTVMREAVKVLAAKGLVEARPKTGTRVRDRHAWNLLDPDVLAWRIEAGPDDRFLADVFTVRRLIEPATARLAAVAEAGEERLEMDDALAAMTAAVDDTEAYVVADLRFHSAIYRACQNELLEHIGETLRAVYRASFALTISVRPYTLPLHRDVRDAIAERDPERAEQAMLALVNTTAEVYDRARARVS
jgi:DNA-binding FadR family transcriptional regulator